METKKIEEVIEEFDFAGELTECIPYGNGKGKSLYFAKNEQKHFY